MRHDMRHEMGHGRGPGIGPGGRELGMRRGMRHRNMRRGRRLLFATLAGGGIAALLTYLFAPKSWNSLTREISDAARNGWNKIEKSAAWVGDEAESLYEDAADEAETLYDEAKTEAGVIYDAAAKDISSAKAAIDDIPKELDDERARLSAGFDADKKAYNSESGNPSQKAAKAS